MSLAQGLQLGEQRAQRKALKKQRDEDLLKAGYSFDNGEVSIRPDSQAEAEQLAIKESVQLSKSLQNKLSAGDTDKAFEDFSHTGDATYLQKAIDNDPNIREVWAQRGVQMVNNIDFTNDTALLERSGFTKSSYDTDEKKSTIKKNAYKLYNGKDWSIGLANRAAAETGVNKRLGNRRSQQLKDNHKDLVDLIGGTRSSPNTVTGHKYEDLITQAAEKYELPPNLLAAMMKQESSGNPDAVSEKGAGGLMQIMPATARDLGVNDVFDPAQSIEGGAKYMSQLLDRYEGDTDKALAAYNAGMGNVDKYGGIPPFGETQKYVADIRANLDEGERFTNNNADNVYSTILEHRRGIALASQGKSVAGADAAAKLESRKVAQGDTKLTQKNRELDLKEQANAVKLRTEGSTTTQKNLAAAEEHTSNLIKDFNSEEEFFQTDFNEPKNYRKAYANMIKIEKSEGTEPSEADKKEMTDLRLLTSLGTDIQKLTGSETGLIDKNLGDLKKYFSDNVKGVAAKASWNAFRNIYVHAMSGSALTPTEAKRNAEALGKLGTKLGPALEMFSTSLKQVGARLDSVSRNMNPYSAKIRLGSTGEELDTIQENIRNTIRYTQGIKEPVAGRKSLDDIFKGQ